MSSSSIGKARLSPAELRRLEMARWQRQEEERHRRAEEVRRRAEAIRSQLALQVRVDHEVRQRILGLDATAPASSETARPVTIADSTPAHTQWVAATRKEMMHVAGGLHGLLDQVPPAVERMFRQRLARHRAELAEILAHAEAQFTTQRERLLRLRSEVRDTLEGSAADVARLAQVSARLEGLRAELVERRHCGAGHLRQALDALRHRLDTLLASGDLDVLLAAVTLVEAEFESVTRAVDEEEEQAQRVEWVRGHVADALREMGYEPTELGHAPAAADEPCWRTPGGHAVRLSIDDHLGVKADFIYASDVAGRLSTDELGVAVEQCRRWCADLRALQERLADDGVLIDLEGELPPERGGIMVVTRDPAAEPVRTGRRATGRSGSVRHRSLDE